MFIRSTSNLVYAAICSGTAVYCYSMGTTLGYIAAAANTASAVYNALIWLVGEDTHAKRS